MVLVWSFQNSPHISLICHPRWPPWQYIVEQNDLNIHVWYSTFFTNFVCVLPRYLWERYKKLIFRNCKLDWSMFRQNRLCKLGLVWPKKLKKKVFHWTDEPNYTKVGCDTTFSKIDFKMANMYIMLRYNISIQIASPVEEIKASAK